MSRPEKYELVVVGGGIAGLSAAIAHAMHRDGRGAKGVVLEKQKRVGGMVTSFKRGGYLFDTTQIVPDVTRLLAYLGVEIPLKRFEGYFARIFIADPASGRAEKIEIPSGLDAFKAMLSERYPRERRQLVKLVDYSEAMFNEIVHLKVSPGLRDLPAMLARCGKIIRNRNLTFEAYLDRFGVQQGEVRDLFDVFASFSGLPCERVAALMVVGAWMTTMRGSYRPEQGFIKLPHRMRRRLESLGGEVRTQAEVDKILVTDGRAAGVRLTTGETLRADHVVVTADTKVAMQTLVGDGVLRQADPAYADQVDAVRMSPSSMSVSLGLDDHIDLAGLGMDCGYNVITTGNGAFETLFKAFDKGEIGLSESCFHTAVICPSLTTLGKPTLVIRGVPMPIADWATLRETDPEGYAERKQSLAEFLIDKVERYVVPNLSRHIEVIDIASPATFARYSGSPTGSNYDMSPYPDNFGRRRLAMKTPIQGLYLPKFSHGITQAIQGGLHAADAILGGVILNGSYTIDGFSSRGERF